MGRGGLGRRPRAAPTPLHGLNSRGRGNTGRGRARRHYRCQKLVTAAARKRAALVQQVLDIPQ